VPLLAPVGGATTTAEWGLMHTALGSQGVVRHAVLAGVALAILGLGGPTSFAAESESSAKPAAQIIRAGSVVRNQAVALGRDLVVEGRVVGDAVALNGQVRIMGEVEGDVIVLGGAAHLASSARVGGNVFVLGGVIEAAPGAIIGGRSVAYPSASKAWLTLLEGPALGIDSSSPLVVGAKLAMTTAWMVLVLLFTATTGRQVLSTSQTVASEPFRCFWVGLTGVLAMVMTALFFNLFSGGLVGVPLILLVVFFAVLLKLWGMVAAFHALGAWLGSKALKRQLPPLNAAVAGLLVLSAIKLVPVAGLLIWHGATFIGVGAALVTKLGRRERWFDLAEFEGAAGRA